MSVNKVVYGDQTLIDVTDTTVTPETLAKGVTAINAAGEKITGTGTISNCYFVTDTESIPVTSLTFSEE